MARNFGRRHNRWDSCYACRARHTALPMAPRPFTRLPWLGDPFALTDSIESDSSVQETTRPGYLGNVYRKVAVRYVFMAEDL
jgi:hypothetical protein